MAIYTLDESTSSLMDASRECFYCVRSGWQFIFHRESLNK